MHDSRIPEQLLFDRVTLESVLRLNRAELSGLSANWQAPCSILLSLLGMYLVSDFKIRFGVSAAVWEALSVLGIISSLLWTIYAIYRRASTPTFDHFFRKLYASSITKQARRVVFVIKAASSNGVLKFLVYADADWNGCYMLPNLRKSETPEADTSLVPTLISLFGGDNTSYVVSDISDLDFTSSKISLRHRAFTIYYFDFVLVQVSASMDAVFCQKEFVLGARTYRWMSLEEMASNAVTLTNNGDVVHHLQENRELLLDRLGSSVSKPIRD